MRSPCAGDALVHVMEKNQRHYSPWKVWIFPFLSFAVELVEMGEKRRRRIFFLFLLFSSRIVERRTTLYGRISSPTWRRALALSVHLVHCFALNDSSSSFFPSRTPGPTDCDWHVYDEITEDKEAHARCT